jgi:hypothetical protein
MIDHATYPDRVRALVLESLDPIARLSSPHHDRLRDEAPTLARAYLDAADQLARIRAVPRGCLDYLGGYGGRDLDIYHHGVATVIAAMDHAATSEDFQARVVEALGSERENDRNRAAIVGAVSVLRSIAEGASGAAAAREFLDWMESADAAKEPTP